MVELLVVQSGAEDSRALQETYLRSNGVTWDLQPDTGISQQAINAGSFIQEQDVNMHTIGGSRWCC